MDTLNRIAKYILIEYSDQPNLQNLKTNATKTFAEWVRTYLDKDYSKDSILNSENIEDEVKLGLIKDSLKKLIQDEGFKNELEAKFIASTKNRQTETQQTMQNVVKDSKVEVKGNVDIGQKGTSTNTQTEGVRNAILNSDIKTGGDFRLGDDVSSENPKTGVFINKNYQINTPLGTAPLKSSSSEATVFQHGYALLVGVGADLEGTVHDAKNLASLLTDINIAAYPPEQVEVLTEAQASKSSILMALDRLIEKANKDPEATVIILYSGHGGRIRKSGEYKYYLYPNDYMKSRDKDLLISGEVFSKKIEKIQSKKLLLLLDCCHAQGIPVTKNEEVGEETQASNKALIEMLAKGEGRIYVASSEDDQYSYATSKGSLFTDAVIEALKGVNSLGANGKVHVLDVLQYLIYIIPKRTKENRKKQSPFINKIENLSADFFICQYNHATAKSIKNRQDVNTENILNDTSTILDQIINNYGNIKKQLNIQTNHGPIHL